MTASSAHPGRRASFRSGSLDHARVLQATGRKRRDLRRGLAPKGGLFIKDEDGYHRIVGRLKEMIKRSGENISASEVEAAMREAPAIAEAAAIAVPDEMRREEVMVLLKLADGSSQVDMPPEEAREHATRLAAFKRPRYVAYVDEFPRTATNKIAKTAISHGDLNNPITDLQNQRVVPPADARQLLPR